MKFIILSSISINSGSGIRIFNIAKELSKKNDVILTGIGNKKSDMGNVKYIGIPKMKSRLLTHFVSLIMNSIVVKTNRADFVISSKTLPSSCIPAIISRIAGRKIIVDVDDLEYGYWKGTRFEGFLRFFDRALPRFFNKITTHTKELEIYITRDIGIPKNRVIFLPQGINYGMLQRKNDNRKKSRLGKKKVILYAAHLGPAAKLDFIFKVFEKILSKRKDITLMVVGGGEYLMYYKKLAKSMGIGKRIIFTGSVDHENISDYMSISDVAVNYLESTKANRYRSSMKVREYLASGIPVVCNIISKDLEQFSEYINSFRTGDIDDMMREILKVIDKPDKKKLAKSREFVKEWDWENIVKNFERELSNV